MGKKKRKQADDQFSDLSLSDSTTNLNNQSESWEGPRSVKKHLNSDSTMFSPRRASLRSAKRFTKVAKTYVSGCSQPQISREHFSVTNVSQQPDGRAENVICAIQFQEGSDVQSPSRCLQPQISREHCSATNDSQQAFEVQAGSDVQSPSRLLKQVAKPSTLTPEMTPEEAEEVGNLIATENDTVNIGEMEEANDAEIISNHLNPMECQNTDLAKCSPLEAVSLAKKFQVSNILEERANKNCSKSSPMFGPTSSSFSVDLTQLVNMCIDEEDDVDSGRKNSSIDNVEGYRVNPNSMPVLRNILNKHGDIAKNCSVSSMKYRSKLLEMICEMVSELQGKEFSKIKDDDLQDMIALLNEVKNVKVDIDWLHLRLAEIREARKIFKQSSMLKAEKDSNRKAIDSAEKELRECEAEKKEVEAKFRFCKETLQKAKDESTKISETISRAKFMVQRFLNCSLVDDLL